MELHPTDYILKCDKTILELPIVNANELLKPHIYQAANRELDAKNMEFRREVYSYFNDTYPECFPSLESTAQALGLSPRTLQRRLKKENTTFHDVLVEFKVNLAKSLLSKNQTAKQIAGKLGYSKVSNFYSSFKKWTGMTVNDFMKLN